MWELKSDPSCECVANHSKDCWDRENRKKNMEMDGRNRIFRDNGQLGLPTVTRTQRKYDYLDFFSVSAVRISGITGHTSCFA